MAAWFVVMLMFRMMKPEGGTRTDTWVRNSLLSGSFHAKHFHVNRAQEKH